MKRSHWIISVLLAGLALALVGGWLRASGLGRPPAAPQASIGTGFTYQGQLMRDGLPINDTCDVAFRLYDAASGGAQVGSAITTSLSISNGLLTTNLDFGVGAFDGTARWLAPAVQCPGDVGFTAFDERQELTPTPYALYASEAFTATTAPWSGLADVPSGFADGSDDVNDADADAGNELNTDIALVDSSLYLTDAGGTLSVDLGGLVGSTGGVEQLSRDFVMASGASVVRGDLVSFLDGEAYAAAPKWLSATVFNPVTTTETSVAALSDTDFVVAYQDSNGYGTAIIGSLSGGSLTWGGASVFNAGYTYDIGVAALSDTNFVIVYNDWDVYGHPGTGIIGELNGGGLIWGSESVFNASESLHKDVTALSDTDFVVAYRDNSNNAAGTAITGTLSGEGLIWGNESVFSAGALYINVETLSGADFVVAYRDPDNSGYGTAITGTLRGESLAWGGKSVFNPASTASVDMAALSATDLVVVSRDYDDLSHGMTVIGTLDGSNLTWGSETVFETSSSTIDVAALSDTDFVVAYRDAVGSGYGMIIPGTLHTLGRASVFDAAYTSDIGVAALAGGNFVVAYQVIGNARYGTARVGSIHRLIGTAKNAASDGATVSVIMDGISDVHNGLTPGALYYFQDDGSLDITPSDYLIGLALSDTELLLDQMW